MTAGEVFLAPMGSAGDVHPYAGVGRELARRGHRVHLIANSYFEPVARRAGLNFVSAGPKEEYLAVIADPDLWEASASYRLMFEKMLQAMATTYRLIAERFQRGRAVVVAPSANFGARVTQEKLGVPLVSMNVEVNIFRSAEEWPGREVPRTWKAVTVPVRRAIMVAMDKWFFDPNLAPRINAFRAELNLRSPVHYVMRNWLHSPDCVIGLFPEWFSGRYDDWPANLHLTGFPLFDDPDARRMDEADEQFLHNGTPPIVFTFGSAMRAASGLFETAVEVCRRLDRRGVLLTEFADQIPPGLPETVRHITYAPFSTLLPKAAALVHHGGVGTTAQGLRAGVPQLVTPMIFDQPYNAVRLRRLGVGRSIPPARFKPDEAAQELGELLGSAEVAQRCREAARRFGEGADPVRQTCDLIEAAMA